MALLFSPDMLVSRPLMMKTFEDQGDKPGSGSQVLASSAGQEPLDTRASCELQVFSAKCSLCEIAGQFLNGFVKNGQLYLLDSGHCTVLYNKLLCWKLSLPDHLTTSNSVSPSVLLLQATYDFVVLKLLFAYTSHAGTDLFDCRNAASLQILHASSMIVNLWIYRGIHTIKHEYWAGEYCSFVARALLPRLKTDTSTPGVYDIIGRACCILNEMARAGVSGRAEKLLEGVEDKARVLKIRVPSYGSQNATDEATAGAPVVVVRGAQVFDGAKGGMLESVGGPYSVSFAKTISDVSQAPRGGDTGAEAEDDEEGGMR